MAKKQTKDSHFIPSPFKVVTEYEDMFAAEYPKTMAKAVVEILKYTAKITAETIKSKQVDGIQQQSDK